LYAAVAVGLPLPPSEIDLKNSGNFQRVQDIRRGKLGTRRAASIYKIPRSTLRNKINKLEAAEKAEADDGSGGLEGGVSPAKIRRRSSHIASAYSQRGYRINLHTSKLNLMI
jgi:predicted transcriptional regulator